MLSPDVKNYEHGYRVAFEIACEQLAKISDIEQQCLKSGAKYQVTDSLETILIDYLNKSYQVTLPEMRVSLGDSEEAVPLKDKVLMLHYLTRAKGTPQSNKIITYKELPEGFQYFSTFSKRTIKPLVDHFGQEPQRLLSIAEILGGYKAEYGDAAVTVTAFPRVSITFVLWWGDEEFPSEGNILFDSVISDYLSTEDITVLCEAIAWKLVKLLRAGGKDHGRS